MQLTAQALLNPLVQQIDALSSNSQDERVQVVIGMYIECVAAVSKGVTKSSASLAPLFVESVNVILRVAFALSPPVHGKVSSPFFPVLSLCEVLFFLHRMVECLGNDLFVMLPPIVGHIVSTSDVRNVVEAFVLLNQTVNRGKVIFSLMILIAQAAAASHTNELFSLLYRVVVDRSQILADGSTLLDTRSEEVRERVEVVKAYLLFLQTTSCPEVASVFISPRSFSFAAVTAQKMRAFSETFLGYAFVFVSAFRTPSPIALVFSSSPSC
jgi:hypothetical protein